ncbi:MAG TPA: dipeptidase [Granulicella sp.]
MSSDALYKTMLVIDGHADTPQRFVDEGWSFVDPLDGGMISLESARQGNLAAEFFAIWVEPAWKGRYAHRAFTLIDGVLQQVKRYPEQLRLCTSADEILAARNNGRFAILLGLEGGHCIENSLALLRCYYELGVRYMTLTWANTNEWADSSGDLRNPNVQHHDGLTTFGEEVIREMNRLGMMVDVSHVSDKTLEDVLRVSQAPIIASHSSARSLTRVPRNLTDEQLRAIAERGGLVMVNFYAAFLDETWNAAWIKLRPELLAAQSILTTEYAERGELVPYVVSGKLDKEFAARLPRPPFSVLIDHIDHIAKVAGIEHVGLGSDFDGIPALPEGIDSAADLPKIAAALAERGYAESDLLKLFGENLLRVFRVVQAHSMQAADAGCAVLR